MIRWLLPHPALSAMLLVVWLLMANTITVGGFVVGTILGVILPKFTQPFWPDRPRIRFGRALIAYLAVVLFDVLVANFQVAWLILFRRNRDLRSRWLVIPIELTTPEAVTMLAGTISLTPGTVSSDVSADGRYLLVHALDVTDEAAEIARIKARYEARLQQVFI
ncbi:Na+/H+ antiporter subunit E [Sphingomonas radiodurans]|uniref:Na+/H+ antiporter subunit E n=1 Tax=Sphingomonas radiodurans TaxID=2890321 RepID=UPI001E44E1ED|nr:Na+/H+ antiporter subunit E [Sphingomonas radiodurans]WBH15064.1 Na+/H+ antiporter subunit E [Sphingomonas radiodurans]